MIRQTNGASGVVQQPKTLEDKILSLLGQKDDTIREQAEEIGELRERIRQLEQRLGKIADDANIGGTANVG